METFKNVTTMAGHTTTMSHPYFAFVQTGQYQLHSLAYQGWFTTVNLQSMGIFMASWRMFSGQQGQSVASTLPLDRWIGNSCTNCPRTYLVLWHRHVKRRNWSYGKKAGNIGATDSWVGDVHDSDFIPTDQGSISVQRERRAEDLPQDSCTDLQYSCKDGWDKSNLEYVHEAFGEKCKHSYFYVYFALTPWAWEVPLEQRKGGPQD